MKQHGWIARAFAAVCACAVSVTAVADVNGPNWNWSNWGYWGYNNTATCGQTFKGNGEACTGFRFRFYHDSCCANVPFRAVLCRWDASSNRAVGPILAQTNSTYFNTGSYWVDKNISFAERTPLQQDQDYVVFFTVTPWWGSYGGYYSQMAINPQDSYPQGNFFSLGNGGDQNAWFNNSWNNQGVDLNFTVYTTADCDSNGIVDAVEIADGSAPDCNANGLLDACEQLAAGTQTYIGDEQGPVGATAEVRYEFERVLPSQSDVQLLIEATGDLGATHEFLIVTLGAGPSHAVFTAAESDCTWLSQTVTISREEFNAAIANDALSIGVSGSPTVDANACKGESKVKIQLDYTESYRDCNDNLINDFEDFCSGVSLDCNGNRNPDECDIASGASLDIDRDQVPDECQPDCNNDTRPDAFQILVGEEPDCNGNGLPDECDLYAAGVSDDCNSNGVPDECDIAAGTSPDCDGDNKIDSCALSAGLVPDCNGNSIPDSCDIASGYSLDCDADGFPDSCTIAGIWRTLNTQTPFLSGQNLVYTDSAALSVDHDQIIQIQYSAASYGYQGWYIRVYFDGNGVDTFYDHYYGGCSNNTRQYTIPMSTWNQAAADGTIQIRVDACPWDGCAGTYCTLRTLDQTEDCNSNAIPDLCDISSGFDHDCNNNGDLDSCDIVAGAEDDNKNGYPDPCELDRGDLNLDGIVNAMDIAILLSYWGTVGFPIGDMNHDNIIDAADLTIMLAHWDEQY